jgi:hypothetical protein
VGIKIASLYAEIGADTSKFVKGMSDTKSALLSSNKHVQNALGGLKNLGLVAGATGAVFGKFAWDAVQSASNLSETVNKMSVIFGSSADDIVKFADTSVMALGQSKQSAIDAASSFAVFGKSAGLSGNGLVDFSTKLTTLTSDLSSFYNTSPEDAITAVGAALRGESEPIRRYGVLLNDATLKQEALKLGLIETTAKALTPQQRVLAAYNVILAQTGDAQGDFGRTSDGLANQQRILAAEFENIKATLGEGFLPTVTKAASGLSKYLDESIRVENAQKELQKAYDAGIISYWEAGRAIEKMRWTEEGLVKVEGMLAKKMGTNVEETGFLRAAMDTLASSTDKVSKAIVVNYTATRDSIPYAKEGYERWRDQIRASQEYTASLEANSEKLSELQELLGGRLGPEMESFRQTHTDLNVELEDAKNKYNELINQGYGESSSKVEEVKGKINELTGEIQRNADEHDLATKRILFDILVQRAAVDGLKTDELNMITTIAEKWGLIDTATADAMKASDQALQDLANGKGMNDVINDLETVSGLSRDIAGNLKSINGRTFTAYFDLITTAQAGQPLIQGGQITMPSTTNNNNKPSGNKNQPQDYAEGGDFIIPPGYPNDTYPIGYGTSGERVTVTPSSQAARSFENGSDGIGDIIKAIEKNRLDEGKLVRLLRDSSRKVYQ